MNDGTETVVTPEEVFAPEQPRDDHGRFAPAEKEETPATVEKEPAGSETAEAPAGEDEGGSIPSWRLRELREERDRVAERATAAERRAVEYERQLAEYRRQFEAARQPQARPDVILDPDKYTGYIQGQFQEALAQERIRQENKYIERSARQARKVYGEEFDKAWDAMGEVARRDNQFRLAMRDAPDPAEAAWEWYQQQKALQEVGGDLKGYKEKLWNEFLGDPERKKQFMDAMDAEARGGNGAGRSSNNVTDLPSLNRMTGSGNRPSAPLGGRELFEATFSPRKRGGG